MRTTKGFTLIEMMVSVSIFSIVMLIATGSVFSIVEANKKTHSLKSVMTNLNFALESMMREIRVGSTYRCLDSAGAVTADPTYGDCINGGAGFLFTSNHVNPGGGYYQLQYTTKVDPSTGVTRIYRRFVGLDPDEGVPITATEIHITSFKLYVVGTAIGDNKQPKAVINIQGYAGEGTTKSTFNIETTVSQRVIDS